MNLYLLILLMTGMILPGCDQVERAIEPGKGENVKSLRERIRLHDGWRFLKYESSPDSLMYDAWPQVADRKDDIVADSRPTESIAVGGSDRVLKKWILPSANEFIADSDKLYERPDGDPGSDFPFVQAGFDDSEWEPVTVPHDWAIKGPFYQGDKVPVGGGMGRLPSPGVAWYRRKLDISPADQDKSIYLDVDGAMSYAMVWLNGHLVGGWPYGYNSFRLDLTPFIKWGGENQLAIRLDNPPNSSRWYPGGGLYRNVWLTKMNPVHVAHWGTFVQSNLSPNGSASVELATRIQNQTNTSQIVDVRTDVYLLDSLLRPVADPVASFPTNTIEIGAGKTSLLKVSTIINQPVLWRPMQQGEAQMYAAVTRLSEAGKPVDEYETRFGIRTLVFDPVKGLLVNGEPVRIQGVNQHHDLGALGAAFNLRAAERQLEILRDMGCNAIRMSHNPPAPELLDLTDRMGFLVIDEIFDSWELKKTPLDFHLIFPEWHEPDLRAFVRRDRNHPSVIAWSFGNEVGEQYTADTGAALAKKLHDIVREEDPTRPATASMNYAKPAMPFPTAMDIITLNYQGEGIRDAPAYAHLKGIKTAPLYPAFHETFPGKWIVSSETASALSTRGTYLFPVVEGISAPVSEGAGGNSKKAFVSAYELYTAPFGASPDKVFASQDQHPYVAGEFVWSGWDYLGEPTPYYTARSSYCGIIDLAGFKKDRFYLYQARWRPDHPMVHILPHWSWPDRHGKITPVHVFTSGDEAELFLNGKSLGRKKKNAYEYRIRWDSVRYRRGELKVIAYKNGRLWAMDSVETTGPAYQVQMEADRQVIAADGEDLSFITVRVLDKEGRLIPESDLPIRFDIEGAGEIVATDNGNPADLVSFASKERRAFNGLALVVVRSKAGEAGKIQVKAAAKGLQSGGVVVRSE